MKQRRPLSIEGTLRLEGPRSDFELRALGPELHLEVEKARGFLDLRTLRLSPKGRSLQRLLNTADLGLSVGFAGLPVARVPAGGRLELQPLSLMRALARRLSAFFAIPRNMPSKTKKWKGETPNQ